MFCIKIQDGRQPDTGKCCQFKRAPTRPAGKNSGYTFGYNEMLLLISLYQKYEVLVSHVSFKKKAIWQMIAKDMKNSETQRIVQNAVAPKFDHIMIIGSSYFLITYSKTKC